MKLRVLPLLIACLFCAAPVMAQDDDRLLLEGIIEDQLSDGAARQVRIEGFRGALSASATLERLSIADAEGEWLILENATLDWTRSALFSRALQIETLSAERLVVLRRPNSDPAGLPTAEATPFSLPELPLRIEIGRVAIGTLDLRDPVLGQAAVFTADGSARLADGAGAIALTLERRDGPEGNFSLDAGYDNATSVLRTDLRFQEAPGGLATALLGIPGQPAVALSVAGTGPIDAFEAELSLTTDGIERINGTVQSLAEPDSTAHAILVDVTGDLTPLLAQEYHGFFGEVLQFTARIDRDESGATNVSDLALRARALTLAGEVSLDAAGRPSHLALSGRIADPVGQGPVRLPVGGTQATLEAATLSLAFDAASGQGYDLSAQLQDLVVDGAAIDSTDLRIAGDIVPSQTGIASVTAALNGQMTGLSHDDPAISDAMGRTLALSAALTWAQGEAVRLRDLVLDAGSVTASGDADFTLGDGQLVLSLDLGAGMADLSRFAGLSGQSLGGGADLRLSGTADLLSGAFDLVADGVAQELRLGSGVPAALFAGETTVGISAVRDDTGLELRGLDIENDAFDVVAAGRIGAAAGGLNLSARLSDLSLVTDAIRGPATLEATLSRQGTFSWQMDADLRGPAGLQTALSGGVGLPDGAVDLQATGQIPLALANRFVAPRSVSGTMAFDMTMRGPPDIASLSGNLSSGDARVSLPTLRAALEDLNIDASLSRGSLTLQTNGRWSSGGILGLNGSLSLTQAGFPGNIDVTLDDGRVVDPSLYEARISRADVTISGRLADAPRVAGTITLGETELRVPETGLGGAAPIPDITHTGESADELRTRQFAGLLEDTSGNGGGSAVGLDLTITAPSQVFLRGRGIDAEFGGEIRLSGTSQAVIPVGRFELVRGRIALLGTQLDITEGAATLEGSFDPYLRLRASSRSGSYTIAISVDGPISDPVIGFGSTPELPEDEVLAQLLFGRSVSALSPVQLVQMADAAASLAGGSSNAGLLSNLREGLGLDDLDLQTDSEGNAVLRAGRYLSENIYSDVTIDAQGEADVSLNIDLTPNITARGGFSSAGDSSVGVFFERDY